ncbi:MAG: nitrous oxide reductase family maturation protein NosD [Candidatus Geothermarchaeales archaeon]
METRSFRVKTTATLMAMLFLASIVVITIPVKAQPTEVWVDDDYTMATPGWGVDHFATIQEGVDAVADGGIVHVAEGTYNEQVVIGKSLTLQGEGDTTIIQPSAPNKLTKIKSTPWFGGTKDQVSILWAHAPGGSVTVKDLKVDGQYITSAPSGSIGRIAGISYIETSGLVDSVTVVDMDTTGYTPRSVGIWASAVTYTSSVEVTDCTVDDYNRGGIYPYGDDLTMDLNHNTIIGPGTLSAQVPNGILFLDGSTGSATFNNVYNLYYGVGTTYRSTGIGTYLAGTGVIFAFNNVHHVQNAFALSVDTSGATVEYNTVYDSHTGVRIESGAADNVIRYNDIRDNTYAIRCGDDMGTGNEAHYNNFVGNIGFDSGFPAYVGAVSNIHTTYTLDAEYNWWGDASGPSGVGPGTGDSVSDKVDFDPWVGLTWVDYEWTYDEDIDGLTTLDFTSSFTTAVSPEYIAIQIHNDGPADITLTNIVVNKVTPPGKGIVGACVVLTPLYTIPDGGDGTFLVDVSASNLFKDKANLHLWVYFTINDDEYHIGVNVHIR